MLGLREKNKQEKSTLLAPPEESCKKEQVEKEVGVGNSTQNHGAPDFVWLMPGHILSAEWKNQCFFQI